MMGAGATDGGGVESRFNGLAAMVPIAYVGGESEGFKIRDFRFQMRDLRFEI